MPRTTVRYDDFALRLEPAAGGGFLARILHSSAGGGANPFELPIAPESLDALMAAVGARVRGSAGDRDLRPPAPEETGTEPPTMEPEELGQILREALFGGRVGEAWARHLGTLDGQRGRGLRLRLAFDPAALEEHRLAALPWELLYQDGTRGYPARNRRTPLVRYLDVEHPSLLPPFESRLRVLGIAASPEGHPILQLATEEARIREAWAQSESVALDFVRRITLEQLRERLLRDGVRVLHFMGHGEFVEVPGGGVEAALLFEDPDHRAERVPASLLAEALRGLEDLHLVVLNACDTGRFPRHRGTDPYSSVAASLVLAGVPAVVAMQFPISDRAAIAFGSGLFRALAAGDPVDAAVTEGRVSVTLDNEETLEWATPVLYSRIAPGAITDAIRDRAGTAAIRERVRNVDELVAEKTRGFVGRGFLFDAVERFRSSAGRGYFRIAAEPGVGKSAMVAELVRRHGWVHHFNQRAANIVRPEAFLSNVCAQLILAHGLDVGELPPEALRDGGYLSEILSRVARRLAPGETTVVLVDALDESSRDGLEPGVNPLYLPPSVPEGIVIVVTTRPEDPRRRTRFDDPAETMELDPRGPENMADIREYVESFVPRAGVRSYLGDQGLTAEGFAAEMADRSEGNFMYLSYVLPAIERGDYGDRPFDDIPAGLERYYEDHFARMQSLDRDAWIEETLPVLEALAVAREVASKAPSADLVQVLSGLDDRRRVVTTLGRLRPFLNVSREETPFGSLTVYSFYHETFSRFVKESEIVALDPRQARTRLAKAYAEGKLDGFAEPASEPASA